MRRYLFPRARKAVFAISLYEEYRGQGTELMRKMLELLANKGYKRASPVMQKENHAVKMYQKVGVEVVGENEQEFIMVVEPKGA